MTWGAFQQEGLTEEIDELGSKLSMEIGCPVHYPAYGKKLYECMCEIVFPSYLLKGENWDMIKAIHEEGKR